MAKIARTEMGTVLTPTMKKDPEFLAKVLALEQQLGRAVCGYKKKNGEPCKNSPVFENGRCRVPQHGGASSKKNKKGPMTAEGKEKASKNATKHGGYSKFLLAGMTEEEQEFVEKRSVDDLLLEYNRSLNEVILEIGKIREKIRVIEKEKMVLMGEAKSSTDLSNGVFIDPTKKTKKKDQKDNQYDESSPGKVKAIPTSFMKSKSESSSYRNADELYIGLQKALSDKMRERRQLMALIAKLSDPEKGAGGKMEDWF